jgi:predicted MFS family arabinose efflux permease
MQRLVESVLPVRLGRDFRWLVASSWTTNLGDGITLAAGPLLIAAETANAGLVGLAWMLSRLPWLLFGLYAGVVADRMDRRAILIVANVFRAGVLAVFAASIASDLIGVWAIMVALFVLGVAEVFADNTASTLAPMVVKTTDLTTANARLILGFVTLNQLAGPPIGAALFALGMWLPFTTQAVIMALGAVLIARVVGARGRPESNASSGPLRMAIADGVRWLWHHPRVRTLAILIFAFNITFGAAFSVLVVLSSERLGLDEFGYGLLIGSSAVGGVIGAIAYGWTERRIGVVSIMRVGLIIETATHLVLATTTTALVAFGILILFGGHAAMWGTLSTSIRQAAVPLEYQGRVSSVYQLALQAGLVIGAGIGAVVAGAIGVTAVYWFGFIGSAVILTVVWRRIANIAVITTEAI